MDIFRLRLPIEMDNFGHRHNRGHRNSLRHFTCTIGALHRTVLNKFLLIEDIIITMNHPVVGHKPLQQRTYIQELSRKEWFTNFLDLITVSFIR